MLQSLITGLRLIQDIVSVQVVFISFLVSCTAEKAVTPITWIRDVMKSACAGGQLIYDGSFWRSCTTDLLALCESSPVRARERRLKCIYHPRAAASEQNCVSDGWRGKSQVRRESRADLRLQSLHSWYGQWRRRMCESAGTFWGSASLYDFTVTARTRQTWASGRKEGLLHWCIQEQRNETSSMSLLSSSEAWMLLCKIIQSFLLF